MSGGRAIVESPKDFFIELDRRDQQQIVMAAMGDVAEELFYEVGGKKGLSWQGINTAAYLMGDIEMDPWVEWERIEMFGDVVYWSATVRARNTKYGLSSLGTAETPEMQKIWDREKGRKIPDAARPGEFLFHFEPDEFCRRKALSKAQRNAKRAVMPTPVLKKWLEYFISVHLFQKGTRLEKPVMPFKPKTADAEFQVLDTKPPEQEPPEEVEPKGEPTQTELIQGKVTVKTVNYNLKAAGVDEALVGPAYEEGDFIIVEAMKTLEDADHYLIFGVLEPMGASVWQEVGQFGQWKLPKKEGK